MSTVVFKRPAEEEEEESEDEGTLQRRAFPLVDGHLGDQSVPPADGAEYLRRVRRQQQELPAVVSAQIEPERLRKAEKASSTRRVPPGPAVKGSMLAALAAAATPPPPPPPATLRPRVAWQRRLLSDFAQLQRRWARSAPPPSANTMTLPDVADANGWEYWCLGAKAGSVREASVSTLQLLDQPRALGLLRGLLRALERAASADGEDEAEGGEDEGGEGGEGEGRTAKGGAGGLPRQPISALGQWAFAALARLDRNQLDADGCATVRRVYVTSVALRGQLAAESSVADEEETQRRAAVLNTLITIAGGHFEQAPREEWEGGP